MLTCLEVLLENIIFILFPFLVYLLFSAYQKNLSKKEDSLFCSLALFTSLYLLLRFQNGNLCTSANVLLDIPLLIGYLKGKKKTCLILSFVLGWFKIQALKYPMLFILLEYLTYYVVYAFVVKKRLMLSGVIDIFVLLKSFFYSMTVFFFVYPKEPFYRNFTEVLLSMILFYATGYLILYVIEKGEDIISLNQTLKELEKEKTLRNSLFQITHEIKNPIAVCKGYLDMFDPSNPEKTKKYLPIVKREIERTLVLMDDFLDYTKIKIDPDIMDIYYLMEETALELQPLFKEQKIDFQAMIPDDELYYYGDYNRLKQVLVNLFKNAIEAKDPKRPLHMEASIKKNGDIVEIMIRDTGRGMDEETLSHMSEMFYTTKQHGTGLGVALSFEIIARHHGTMTYHSVLGEGTTVIISLPIMNPQEKMA